MSKRCRKRDLQILLSTVSGHDASIIGPDADLLMELGFDSLAALRMLAAVEKRFDVRFPDHCLGDIRTLRQLLDVIEKP